VREGSCDSLDNSLGSLAAHAVVTARGPAHQRDASKPDPTYGGDARVAEGWTEQAGTYARRALDRTDRAQDIVPHGPWHAERGQAVVDISRHAERVTAGVNLAHHIRMAARLGAQYEERRAMAGCPQRCQDPSCRHRIGPVIERERDAHSARRDR